MISTAITQLLRAVLPVDTQIGPGTDSTKTTAANRVLYTRIDSDTPSTDEGSSGIVSARYQLDIFAPTLMAAETLRDKVRKKWVQDGSGGIENYKGTIDTTKIDTISFDTDSFQSQDKIEGDAGTLARCLQDFNVTYRE
jgi:hypothetical protein